MSCDFSFIIADTAHRSQTGCSVGAYIVVRTWKQRSGQSYDIGEKAKVLVVRYTVLPQAQISAPPKVGGVRRTGV